MGAAPERITGKICAAIKAQIASGTLGTGEALPSTRSLAAEWGVSRTTVTAAYDQLAAEGYLETAQGARARVAQGLRRQPASSDAAAVTDRPDGLSSFGRTLAGFPMPSLGGVAPLVADFRYGELSAADFPMLAWKKALGAAVLRRQERLKYGDPQGSPALRAALQAYLWRARGLACEPEQIIVVNGSQQGLDLCARLLLDPGDGTVMEEPGYVLAREVFLAAGAQVFSVPVDQDGLQTDALPPARLAYVTPSHQFPLGGVLSAGRRRALLAWAQQSGAYVVEDDYDSEYRFDIAPIPPLRAMDEAGRVIYLGTVSKTLSPTVRLGFLVVPPALVSVFARAKRLTDRHSPSLEQEALATMLDSGAYDRHVRRVRRRNGERRAALLEALSTSLGSAATVVGADAGLHVVVWLDAVPKAREDDVAARARGMGLGLYPITPLYASHLARPDRAGFVIGYAGTDERIIAQGVRLLARLLADLAAEGRHVAGAELR